MATSVLVAVAVEHRRHEAELEIPAARPEARPAPVALDRPAVPPVASLARESVRRGLSDTDWRAGLMPGASADAFRPATTAEVVLLQAELARQSRVLEGQTRMLERDAHGERTPAMVLALEKAARQAAAAQEIRAGRVFVRHGPVPEDAVRECRARDGAVVLIDEGSLHSAVFLDPALHRAWAALRDEWRACGAMSYDTARFTMPRPGTAAEPKQAWNGGQVPPGDRR